MGYLKKGIILSLGLCWMSSAQAGIYDTIVCAMDKTTGNEYAGQCQTSSGGGTIQQTEATAFQSINNSASISVGDTGLLTLSRGSMTLSTFNSACASIGGSLDSGGNCIMPQGATMVQAVSLVKWPTSQGVSFDCATMNYGVNPSYQCLPLTGGTMNGVDKATQDAACPGTVYDYFSGLCQIK